MIQTTRYIKSRCNQWGMIEIGFPFNAFFFKKIYINVSKSHCSLSAVDQCLFIKSFGSWKVSWEAISLSFVIT